MAPSGQDDNDKTEEPSHRRLEQALQKGQVASSKELVTFALFLAAAPYLVSVWPTQFPVYIRELSAYLSFDKTPVVNQGVSIDVARDAIFLFLMIFIPFGMVLWVAGLVIAGSQHPLLLSSDQMKPKFDRVSPFAGVKRLFSLRSFLEFIKGIAKLLIITIIGYIACAGDVGLVMAMSDMAFSQSFAIISDIVVKFLVGLCIFTGAIGILDYLYQRYELTKSLRMSVQEIKDEYKETEGNPEIKAKLRQIRAERAQQRMAKAVPKSDVVITNPTHYAVALAYDMEKDRAPRVTAKGIDYTALRIRQLAEENGVPIVRNPPLARALYDGVEVDSTVPEDLFRAVAEVIRYVFSLRK